MFKKLLRNKARTTNLIDHCYDRVRSIYKTKDEEERKTNESRAVITTRQESNLNRLNLGQI